MEFKRVQKQMWHNTSMAADDVLMDGDRKRQLQHTEKVARTRQSSIEMQ